MAPSTIFTILPLLPTELELLLLCRFGCAAPNPESRHTAHAGLAHATTVDKLRQSEQASIGPYSSGSDFRPRPSMTSLGKATTYHEKTSQPAQSSRFGLEDAHTDPRRSEPYVNLNSFLPAVFDCFVA